MALDAPGIERSRFGDVGAGAYVAAGRFAADVSDLWTIGDKPNGGYLLAMLSRAAAEVCTHPHPIAASATYVRSPVPGPVEIATELVRQGRSASQVRAQLRQGDAICVEALLTMSELSAATVAYWDHGAPPMPPTPLEGCARLVPKLPDGMRVAIMEQVGVYLEPTCTGFIDGRPSGAGVLSGWLTLPDDEPFDPAALLFALDGYPPATFDVEFSGWVPTLELTAYVRAIPAPGPVRVLQRAHLIAAQRVDESCTIWDSAGRLVAQGTQLAGIRLG